MMYAIFANSKEASSLLNVPPTRIPITAKRACLLGAGLAGGLRGSRCDKVRVEENDGALTLPTVKEVPPHVRLVNSRQGSQCRPSGG